MKKNYISPDAKSIIMYTRSNLLLSLSATQATTGSEDATVNFSREADFELDGEY